MSTILDFMDAVATAIEDEGSALYAANFKDVVKSHDFSEATTTDRVVWIEIARQAKNSQDLGYEDSMIRAFELEIALTVNVQKGEASSVARAELVAGIEALEQLRVPEYPLEFGIADYFRGKTNNGQQIYLARLTVTAMEA